MRTRRKQDFDEMSKSAMFVGYRVDHGKRKLMIRKLEKARKDEA